jgi:hypothetical protein
MPPAPPLFVEADFHDIDLDEPVVHSSHGATALDWLVTHLCKLDRQWRVFGDFYSDKLLPWYRYDVAAACVNEPRQCFQKIEPVLHRLARAADLGGCLFAIDLRGRS